MPILFVVSIGALNTSFVKGWRGIGSVELCDRHISQDGPGIEITWLAKSGGLARLLPAARQLRARRCGRCAISMVVTVSDASAVAAVVCAATTGIYPYLHADRRWLAFNSKRSSRESGSFRALRRGELDSGTPRPQTTTGRVSLASMAKVTRQLHSGRSDPVSG